MEEIKTLSQLERAVIDTKCSVLRDYIHDLEKDLKMGQEGLKRAEALESGHKEPVDLSDAVVMGMNDYMYRYPIGYLEAELTKAKYELSISIAKLQLINEPESKYDIDKIKAYPIKEFIQRFTTIKGNNQAICPIHREKTPSLHIYENTNSWFCFGHNSGGSVIDFMMQLNNYSAKEALDDLSKLI